MNRDYINYVGEACKNGMNAEEVQYLFSDIYKKSNTRKGKKILKLFAQGIGKAKKNVLINQPIQQSYQNQQFQQPMQQSYQNQQFQQAPQEKGYQYQYFKQ